MAGQRLMQAASDVFLGWDRYAWGDATRDLYVRQLRDWKARPRGEDVGRSGDRRAIAAYLGMGDTFDDALVAFSAAYADRNERDHAELLKAIADGRLAS